MSEGQPGAKGRGTYRSSRWAVCMVYDEVGDRRLAMVKPGAPLRGWRVLEHEDETIAQLVLAAISKPAPFGEREPSAGSPIGMRRQADEALTTIEARWARRAA